MVVSAHPALRKACAASPACVLLAFWLDAAGGVPPTQQVSNVRFQDTNGDGGWISGTIEWDPPANTTGLRNYAVVMFNNMNDIAPLPPLPGSMAGAWYLCDLGNKPHALVGSNNLTITTYFPDQQCIPRRGSSTVQPENRRRYVWGHFHPPDRYLGVACVNHQKEAGPSTVIPLYDSTPLLPIKHIESVSFVDTNSNLGELSGKISWDSGVEGDFALTKSYNVYLADDNGGTGAVKIGDTTVPTFELSLSSHNRAEKDFIHIRAVNHNGESSWSTVSRVFDLGPSVPSRGVTALAFTDTDYAQGQVAGYVTWTPPDDEAPISSYKIFLTDRQGFGGVGLPAGGYQVPVGTNQFLLPTYVIRNTTDYIQVYATNDKGMQQFPTELAILDGTGS